MCVDPIIAFYSYKDNKFVSFNKLALFKKDDLIKFTKISGNKFYLKSGYYQILPCRKCIGCQIDRSLEWKVRLINESKYYNNNNMCFITLTYDDKFLPTNSDDIPILKKSDCQLFLKRLRKYFKYKEIRYFLCGEYGSKTKRPHYHLILYGLGLQDFRDIELEQKKENYNYYHSLILEKKIWKLGKCVIAPIDDKVIGYCASYCVKKINKEINYDSLGIVKPFILTSRGRGGLGSRFIKDNKNKIIDNDFKFFTHYDNKTYNVSVPLTQKHYLLDNVKTKDFKVSHLNVFKDNEDILNKYVSVDAYVEHLKNTPFFKNSTYFKLRAELLKNKIQVLKGGL